jgi:hypothetical protein
VDINLIETIKSILTKPQDSLELRKHIRTLLEPIRVKNISYLHNESKEAPNQEDLNIFLFINSWSCFPQRDIPYEYWSDINEEGLALLKKLLEDPSVPYEELEGFKEFNEKVYARVKDLKFKHGYADRFTMDAYN